MYVEPQQGARYLVRLQMPTVRPEGEFAETCSVPVRKGQIDDAANDGVGHLFARAFYHND